MKKPDAVRAKFDVSCVCHYQGMKKIVADTVYDSSTEENKDFTDATPSGQFELICFEGTKSYDFFSPGEQYYLDFRSQSDDSGADKLQDLFTVNKVVDRGGEKEIYLKAKPLPDEYPDGHSEFSTGPHPAHNIQITIWDEYPAWLFFEVEKEVFVSVSKAPAKN